MAKLTVTHDAGFREEHEIQGPVEFDDLDFGDGDRCEESSRRVFDFVRRYFRRH